ESLEETQKLGSAILPYLREAQIAHKIVNALNENVAKHYDSSQEYSDQFGKTITIYPASIISFEQIAKDINHIIKQNNLQTNDSNIVGDRLLDDTGRIFYRYDGASKSRPGEYDENRGGDKYMAADMTTTDDPFVNLRFEDKV
ncbi:MAG: hypothetical protein LW817_07185, partial [Candidatus Caenarcaniphilales bacterium]|nr:hypothetical protein [Candidatus Caenarcaniphilales bacterium]